MEHRYKSPNAIHTLLQLYRGEVSKLGQALLFYAIKHSGVWALPLVTASIIDVINEPQQHQLSELWLYAVFLVFIYIQNVPTHYIYIHYFSTANRNMETKLRSTLAWRLQQLSMDFHFRTSTGALQTKLLRDVELIEQLTRQLFETIPVTLITLLIAMITTAIRAPLFLIFFIVIIPLTVLLVHKMRVPMESRNRRFRQEMEGMSSRLIEMIHLIPVTRAHGVEEDELKRIDERLVRVRDSGLQLDKVNALFGATSWVVMMLGNTLCLITAAYFAFTGRLEISVGDVVLLTGYFNTITASVSTIIALLPQIAKGFESVKSLAEVLESPDLEQNQGKPLLEQVRGHFSLENVSFTYPDSTEHSLIGLNLDVPAGETIAIVGASGAGKSTLLNLLIGFIRPTEGRILLDGVDMNTVDLRSYRHFLSVVPQNTILFQGTVRDNILYGSQNISDNQLWEAIRAANAEEFVRDLPNGVDTLLGENGTRLSGGQRQRIAIARAVIRNPSVLILDEATSALDTQSEKLIQEAFERLMQKRTTFVVAHRLSTIQNAHRIVVMEQGRVVEIGNHAELLARGGVYANLHQVRTAG